MRLIDGDAKITALLYNNEHEETERVEMSIADFLDGHTEEGCPQAVGGESVKPVYQGDDSYICDNCGETVGWEEMACCGIDQVKFKYCPGCGRKVKWDD